MSKNSNVHVLRPIEKTPEMVEVHEIQVEHFKELTPPNDDYDYVREICQWYEEDELVGSDDMAAVTLMASYVFDNLATFVLWSSTKSVSFTIEDIDKAINAFREDDRFVNAFFASFPVALSEFYQYGFRSGMWPPSEDEEIDFAEN